MGFGVLVHIWGWHHTRRASREKKTTRATEDPASTMGRANPSVNPPSGLAASHTHRCVGQPPRGRCRDTERTLLYFSRTLLCRDQARARWPASTSKASSRASVHGCSWRPAPGASHSTSQDSRVKLSVSISSAALPANALRVDLEDALLPAAEAPLAVSGQAEQTVDA